MYQLMDLRNSYSKSVGQGVVGISSSQETVIKKEINLVGFNESNLYPIITFLSDNPLSTRVHAHDQFRQPSWKIHSKFKKNG